VLGPIYHSKLGWQNASLFGLLGALVTALLAALPYLAVGLGSLALFFPARRAKYVEKTYGLAEPPGLPAMDEIAAFARQHAPDLVVRTNLLRGNMLCFVYPAGRKEARLAVFGGLVRLWATDRNQAQAVLLHEIAHFQRGDAFHLGAGSAFELGLRVAVFALALYIVPWLFNFTLSGRSHHPDWMAGAFIMRLLDFLLSGMSVIWPVLAATWVAEYGADFQAASRAGADTVSAALDSAPEEGGPLRCFLNRLTHPSLANRKRMLQRPPEKALLRMSLIFPLTLLYVTCINLLGIMFVALAFSRPLRDMVGYHIPIHIMPTLQEMEQSGLRIFLLFLLLALTCFLWPVFHAKYASLWAARPRTDRTYSRVYAKAGGLVLLMLLGAMALWFVMMFGVDDWWRSVS
jgi:Zn-dependent protease with chaperone function